LKYKKTFNNIKNETEWDMSNIDTSENDNRAPNYELSVKFIENLVDEEGDILRENQNQNFLYLNASFIFQLCVLKLSSMMRLSTVILVAFVQSNFLMMTCPSKYLCTTNPKERTKT